MSQYIVSLEKVGRAFYMEVSLFCMALGQSGKEVDVYKETFSQIMSTMTVSHQDFIYNIMSLPQLASLVYVEIQADHEPAINRFREATRVAAIQLRDLLISNPNIQHGAVGSVYLMDMITFDTLVFSIHVDATFV